MNGAISSRSLMVVTGREDPIDPREPFGALSEFYRAFNGRDLALMERNWISSAEASMANPLGGIRRGWADIREFYERFFHGPSTVSIEFVDYTIQCSGEMFYAVGKERGLLQGENLALELKFRTSRLFRFSGERWRQVHHHGSIENPELLLRYQAAIR
jgi:ketosteroid isomerase-like protein